MAVYSKDTDLELYVRDVDRLPLPMTKFHEEAYKEVRRVLRGHGVAEADLDNPDADTLEALKGPACHYVLALFFGGFTADDTAQAAAKEHRKEFERTIRNVEFKTSEGEAAGYSSGQVLLG